MLVAIYTYSYALEWSVDMHAFYFLDCSAGYVALFHVVIVYTALKFR